MENNYFVLVEWYVSACVGQNSLNLCVCVCVSQLNEGRESEQGGERLNC